MLGVPDVHTKHTRPEARSNIIDLADVPSQADGQGVNDNDKVIEVQVPGVEGEVQDRGEDAGAEDCAAAEELPADEVYSCEVALPDVEGWEEEETDDDHGDEGGGVVAVDAAVGLEGEWEEEEDEGSAKDEGAGD